MDSHKNIPPNILLNIIVRLDVKTLVRLKCVCKAWLNLISSNPKFQDYHYSKWQHNLQILFRSPGHAFPTFTFLFASLPMTLQPGPAFHTITARIDGPIKLLLPSCWGLVCFATKMRIYVYNPTTKRLLVLPPSPKFESVMCGFGFGYIPSKGCYTVVQFMYEKFTERIECLILQVGRGAKESELSWRVLEQACPYFVDEFSLPASCGETIYWKVDRDRNRDRRRDNYEIIMGFNIEQFKFFVIPYPSDGVISYPSNWKYPRHDWTQLMNVDGVLWMMQNFTSHIRIWTGRNQRWQRLGAIDLKGIDFDMTKVVEIMYINKNGEIILASNEGHLHLYDFRKRTCRTLHQTPPFPVLGLAIYSESLFQLN
ncbi:F-box and associated interaction domains-containing protein [Euphorbia peplus]|nr:F-box and associated interaction domains-containing protein [Euphorbia peplus]